MVGHPSARVNSFGAQDPANWNIWLEPQSSGRKLDDERGSVPKFALAPDFAVHRFHHLLHDGQG
jgi:hypothetical protein